jgi:hypothetical protein
VPPFAAGGIHHERSFRNRNEVFESFFTHNRNVNRLHHPLHLYRKSLSEMFRRLLELQFALLRIAFVLGRIPYLNVPLDSRMTASFEKTR